MKTASIRNTYDTTALGIIIVIGCLIVSTAYAAERVVNLTVGYKTVNFAGKSVQAIAVNDQIPAPTLHFKEGDHVTINVYNHLDKGTTIHWHGLLVPWQMDGVNGISQTAIPPGGVFHYQFTLYQSGTYWYHSHTGLQEQLGLYGGIIIDPPNPPPYHYNKDFFVILSDWSNTAPDTIYANLKKSGDYYSSRFPIQPSLTKFLHDYKHASPQQRKLIVNDYKMMQKSRMSMYDFSDIAYDAFLLNGKTASDPWQATVKVGDIVRLRFVGAGASTIFHVKIPNTTMEVVQIDGNDVKPYDLTSLTVAPGETFDVLLHINKPHPYIIYAESSDTLGAAVGALTTSPHQVVNYQHVKPFPEPAPVRMGAAMMSGMKNTAMPMDMGGSMMDKQATTNSPKYQNVTAAVTTNDPNKPIQQVIKMDLAGYMDQYIWFINGLPEYKAKPIMLLPNKRYRIIFTNKSMMHHPMHIHGHWFIIRNGHGKYDPILHTIDIAPGDTVVADVDTDASGQWFFHCHHLYHLTAGMAQVFQYSTLIDLEQGKTQPQQTSVKLPYANQAIVRQDNTMPLNHELVNHPIAETPGKYLANVVDISEDPSNNTQELTYKGLWGSDYKKLELFLDEAEMDKGSIENGNLDIFYWQLVSEFWAIKGGANYVYRPAETPYWQPGIGIEGLMPFFIDTDVRTYYHDGSAQLNIALSRNTQITNRFFITTGITSIFASKAIEQDDIGNGLNEMQYSVQPNYQVNPTLSVYLQYQYTGYYATLKRNLEKDNQATTDNTYSIGLSMFF